MKKLLLIAGVFALILSSCTQDLPVVEENSEQEVIFTSNDLKGMKGLYDCDDVAEYAKVWLTLQNGDAVPNLDYPLIVPVFYVNNVMYTQAIKLPSGETGITYKLEKFELFDADDLMVNAVPLTGSEYGNMVSVTLPLDIDVSPFTKAEIPLSILCYTEEDYDAFGFTWFRINEEEITNKFFFGDFCTKFFEDYADDDYYGPTTAVDMKAIFELTLLEKDGSSWNVVRTVDNIGDVDAGNSGGLLELIYPTDNDPDGDLFRIDIKIRVKVGTGFQMVDFGSWYFEDESDVMYTNEALDQSAFDFGTDGVYDFILGNCNANGADFMFAPYMNLPSGQIHMDLAFPGTDSYFTATLSGIGAGYDLTNGDWDAYCFDLAHTINGNGSYDVDVYSTLYESNLPAYMQNENWGAVNWLANYYTTFDDWTWEDVQVALWILEDNAIDDHSNGTVNGVTGDPDTIDAMVAQALDNDDFVPMPGGWAAVVLEHSEGTQTIFVIVDP